MLSKQNAAPVQQKLYSTAFTPFAAEPLSSRMKSLCSTRNEPSEAEDGLDALHETTKVFEVIRSYGIYLNLSEVKELRNS